MSKPLSEMTLEELWQLFPILLAKHQACWSAWYEEEAACLRRWLPAGQVTRISHIGSTAVEGIWAKPIVDILVELKRGCKMQPAADCLTGNGYLCMHQSRDRMVFNKGYTEQGFSERVFHLHMRYEGDNGELYGNRYDGG